MEAPTVRWTDGTGTSRWTAPPSRGRAGLEDRPERLPSRHREKRAKARPAAPASTLHSGLAPISKATTEAMRKTRGRHRIRTATFRVAARYLADPVTSSRLRPPSNAG